MGKALRILHLNDRLSDRGGADWHLRGVLHHLSKRHKVLLAVGRKDSGVTADCETRIVANLDSRTDAPIELHDIVADFQPDIVHVHNVVNPTALHWASQARAIMTVQDHRSFCPGQGKMKADRSLCTEPMEKDNCISCFGDEDYFLNIFTLTSRRLLSVQAMRRVIVLSHYMREELVQVGTAPEIIEVIPPFVHGFSITQTEKKNKHILFVGRLVHTKGIHDAIEAWKRSGIELPLVIAGAGPVRGEINEEGVEFKGWLSRQDLGELYRNAAMVVLCSRWQEPFGIVGLEALSQGTPVVAWESGGISEWYPGKPTPWGNVDALAQSMTKSIGVGGPKAPQFEPEPLMRRLEDLYAECSEMA